MLASAVTWFLLLVLVAALVIGLRFRRAETLLVLGAAVVTLLISEAVLRAVYPPAWRPLRKIPSRDYHHINPPSVTMYQGRTEGRDVLVRTNEDGFRSGYGRAEFLRYRDRVVILGDSFTFGSLVSQEAAFPQVIERELRERLRRDDIAVLNGGIISYSPLLAKRTFNGLAVHYRPTLVLFVLDPTDIGDDYNYENELVADAGGGHFDWDGLEVTPYYGAVGQVVHLGEILGAISSPVTKLRRMVGLKPASARPYDWYRFRAQVGGRPENNRFFIYRHPLEETRPHFERSYGYIEALAQSVQRAGATFVLVVTPRYHHWNPKECPDNWETNQYAVDEPYQYEYFRYFAERRPGALFEIYDLLPAFRSTREFPLVLREDPHWNAAGNAFVARTLADHLIASGRFNVTK
jgi:hypothetical protein